MILRGQPPSEAGLASADPVAVPFAQQRVRIPG